MATSKRSRSRPTHALPKPQLSDSMSLEELEQHVESGELGTYVVGRGSLILAQPRRDLEPYAITLEDFLGRMSEKNLVVRCDPIQRTRTRLSLSDKERENRALDDPITRQRRYVDGARRRQEEAVSDIRRRHGFPE